MTMGMKLDELLPSLAALHAAGKIDPLRYAEFLAKYTIGARGRNENREREPVVVRVVRD